MELSINVGIGSFMRIEYRLVSDGSYDALAKEIFLT